MAYESYDKKDCHCKEKYDRDCCPDKCPPGPQGPQGVQGVDGVQGPKGNDGVQGIQGSVGAMGPQGIQGQPGNCVNCPGEQGPKGDTGPAGAPGPMGPAGEAGSKGDKGDAGPAGPVGPQGPAGDLPELEFMEIYSTTDQVLTPSLAANTAGGIVKFETTQVVTAAFDVTLAASAGQVKILKAGWYRINKAVSGTLNPISSPLRVWTLSIFVNGVIMPASTFGDMTISPEQKCNQTTSSVIAHFNIGDIITMANTSDSSLILNSETFGSMAIPLCADMNMSLLKAD